jgi:hypothetical protein
MQIAKRKMPGNGSEILTFSFGNLQFAINLLAAD